MSSSTSSTTAPAVPDAGAMTSSHPREGQAERRRRFTPAQKLEHLAGCEQACEHGQGGAYLRREGLYSSLISEWRWLRDAGVLAGKKPGEAVGAPTRDQAESARLRRALEVSERRLATTETALQVMGKVGAALAGRPVPG